MGLPGSFTPKKKTAESQGFYEASGSEQPFKRSKITKKRAMASMSKLPEELMETHGNSWKLMETRSCLRKKNNSKPSIFQ